MISPVSPPARRPAQPSWLGRHAFWFGLAVGVGALIATVYALLPARATSASAANLRADPSLLSFPVQAFGLLRWK